MKPNGEMFATTRASTDPLKGTTTAEHDTAVGALDRQFAEITVQEQIRPLKRLSMPSNQLAARFDVLSSEMLNTGNVS